VVGELCSRRSEALRQETAPLTSPAHDLQGGRLLLFAPQATVWDGASASVSKGFFDVADAPPWDTWVWVVTGEEGTAFYSPYLIAWVPPIFLELADAGIRVSPVNNVAWAKDVETATVRQLRVLGIT